MSFWSWSALAALAWMVACRPDDEPKKVPPPRVETPAGAVERESPRDAGMPVSGPARRIPTH
ncbi:MAG TPA: hypothetical protein VGY53_10145 [Isosphaeraceae bacterium]|nr:hypothetical protein [Isosphaeraceae bacterium]